MESKMNLLKRVDDLIEIADKTLAFVGSNQFEGYKSRLRSQGLSFIISLNGTSHPNYSEFERCSGYSGTPAVKSAREILKGIKYDIENDHYLTSVKGLVSAEIFCDYLEMAGYLLSEEWYIPAAVIVGSTLEAHLKKLCDKKGIPRDKTDVKGRMYAKAGSELNSDLYKAEVYNKIDWGLVESWQKIRNDAAHGNYNEFNLNQVKNMLLGAQEFIGRNTI